MVKKTVGKQTSLFDIRLKNLDHDVLVLKGSENEAISALMAGKVVLSVNEPLVVKRLNLRLYGTVRLHWMEHFQTTKGPISKPMKFEKRIFEHKWDNLKMTDESRRQEATGPVPSGAAHLSRTSSSTTIKHLGHSFRSKSSGNLSSLIPLTSANGSASSSSVNLQAKNGQILYNGNYEFPFSAILPGSMPESVEGLPGASVVYKLEATIDRGKFHNNLTSKKHFRVVRTLTTDAVELSETVAVDNTWPGKVEYSLNVPSKAIAVGSGTPISFMLVPLLKGLRLGDIDIRLIEHYSYMGYIPPAHNGERIISEKHIPKSDDDDANFSMEKWEVDTFLKVPPNLSKCTQDCDVDKHIKVRHKIKFVIGLINPDGHVSELRASLPVSLFVSPFVSIVAKQNTDNDEVSLNEETNSNDEDAGDEVLFSSDQHGSSTSLSALEENSDLRSNSNSVSSFTGLMAPPVYEKHIYDRLWSDVSPVDTPINSGSATPRAPNEIGTDVSHFSMSPLDSAQLTENLRNLHTQRQDQERSENVRPPLRNTGSRSRAVFNLDGENSTAIAAESSQTDYFSGPRPASSNLDPQGLSTPGVASPPNHLSRVGSENSLIDSATLSRLPSYHQAIRSEAQDEVLSPVYEPPLPGSNIRLAELGKRPEEGTNSDTGSAPPLNRRHSSRGSSSLNLKHLGRSPSDTSPGISRNVSTSNMASLAGSLSKAAQRSSSYISSNSSSASLSGLHSPITAVPTHPAVPKNKETVNLPNHLTSSSSSVTQPSSSASDRSAAIATPLKSNSTLSLQNLHFINKKKENK